MSARNCEYCHQPHELRPYGRNGAWVCFDCAMKPENKSLTEEMFLKQLDACGGEAIIDGDQNGPRPVSGGRQ